MRAPFTIMCAVIGLAGCAPPGFENAAFTSVRWPNADTPLTIDQRAEIEGRLRALGYLKEPADAVITVGTRAAISRYQGDIGAPSNGFVTAPLLDSLRLNTSFLSAEDIRNLTRTGRATTRPTRIPRTSTPRAATSVPISSDTGNSGEAGGGGAGGASGGGAWN